MPTEVCRAKGAEGEFLRSAGIDKHWVTSSGYMSCVSASGKWLGHAPSLQVLEAFQKLPAAERQPGAVVVPDLDPADRLIPSPPEGGLVLRVHARFLSRTDNGELRPARQEDFPLARSGNLQFLLSPNTEYLWLTREEWRSLVPANPAKGDRLEVSPAICDRIARFHLVPRRALTSEDGILPKTAVKTAKLTLVVEDVTPDRIHLSLEGFVHTGSDFDAAKATTPNGPLPFGFATPLYGTLVYDRSRQALVQFDLVAPGEVWGRWGDANNNSMTIERPGRSPIGFAFELAKGDTPTDRIPPAGNGGRALRNGYFTASK